MFEELINDLVEEKDLSVSLRRAKVLAYRLGNVEFKEWVENELNGYRDSEHLPDYRKLKTMAQGDFMNVRWKITGQLIPITSVPKDYRSFFEDIHLTQGVKELETYLGKMGDKENDSIRLAIPPEVSSLLHSKVFEYTQCMRAWRVLNAHQIIGVLEFTRNALLNFALELGEKFPALKGDVKMSGSISDDEVKQLFNIIIQKGNLNLVGTTGSTIQTEAMTTFNQQGQQVTTQYNAGGDINFGNVTNLQEFSLELVKLKDEFIKAAAEETVDGEIVTDVEYELTKAIHGSQKDAPDKSSIIKHLEKAKAYVDGVGTLAKVATGIAGAIEAIRALL